MTKNITHKSKPDVIDYRRPAKKSFGEFQSAILHPLDEGNFYKEGYEGN